MRTLSIGMCPEGPQNSRASLYSEGDPSPRLVLRVAQRPRATGPQALGVRASLENPVVGHAALERTTQVGPPWGPRQPQGGPRSG